MNVVFQPKEDSTNVRVTLDLKRSEYNDLLMLQKMRGARSKAQVLRDLIREDILKGALR